MKRTNDNIWYSFRSATYEGKEPAYYDTGKFAWISPLENNFINIKNEIIAFVNQRTFDPYFNTNLVAKPGGWQTPLLFAWGKEYETLTRELPILAEELKKIKGMLSCSISILEPGTTIKEHYGDTNAIIRNHLGIIIPEDLPRCGISVKGEERGWKEGKVLSFCDAHLHSAWNKTSQRRVVVIFDVLKEEYADRKDEICANVLSGFWLQKIRMKYKIVNWLPRKFQGKLRRRQARLILKNNLKTDLF